jgi:hypothetical protein
MKRKQPKNKTRNNKPLALEPLENRLMLTSISSDFSTDPGFETNKPTHYEVSNNTLKVSSYTNSQEYATIPIDHKGESFTLEFDINITRRTSGDTNFGLFSESRKTNQKSPGDPAIYALYGGYEQGIHIFGFDSEGNFFSQQETPPRFELNTTYHNTLTYNSQEKEATLTITSNEDPNYGSDLVLKANLKNQLPPLTQLGASAVGSWSSSGRYQRSKVDNLEFKTTNQNPNNPKDINADGIISSTDLLIALNNINENRSTTLHSTTPYFLDVNGDRHNTPIDALQLINHLNNSTQNLEAESPTPSSNLKSNNPPTHNLQPTLVDKALTDEAFTNYFPTLDEEDFTYNN